MEHEDVTLNPEQVTLPKGSLWTKLPLVGGILGILGIGASLALGSGEHSGQLAFSYLTGFFYWLTIALGGLFFVLLHFLCRSGWSVVIRRLAENVMGTLPVFAVLSLPLWLFWMHDLYHWTHEEAVAHDPLLQHKAPYLDVGFFWIRLSIYFVIWTALAVFYWRQSRLQDQSGAIEITDRLQRRSAPGMVLFALTLNFAAMDWLMTLDPHWYSTIFGVYTFAGTVVAILAFLILVTISLQRAGALGNVVTGEHFHDLGKLLFGFVVFWAYIGFSQFMLIWYANIPEETAWFDHRWHHGWEHLSIFLAVGHFAVPFFFLISQPVKRNQILMTIATLWLLFMHYIDIYWLVMPTHNEVLQFSPLDLTCWVGIGGFFLASLGVLMQKGSLVPQRDPRLAESLAFESA